MTANSATPPWCRRLDDYLDRLQQVADRLQQAVAELGESVVAPLSEMSLPETPLSELPSSGAQPPEPSARQAAEELLRELEELVVWRVQLIQADDAPAAGLSLRQIVSGSTLADRGALLRRCDTAARSVQNARERALACFVCQFHLADLTGKLLAILTGTSERSATYGAGGREQRAAASSGHLLNRSA